GLLPILTSSPGPDSSADKAPSFADPEFRGVHEGPFTIGEILAAVEKRGEVAPKIIMVSSTTDFLSLRASLGRTGGAGTEEQAIPANVRMYDVAGASHVVLPHSSECTLPLARLDWSPVSRATLVALDGWVGANVAPPDSQLMPLEPTTDADVLAAPKHLPKAVIERPKRDADGNVLGGVRLPDMAAPVGVHAAQQEPKSFGCSLAGAFLPFSEARIAELYKNRDDYVNQVRVAARKLEVEKLLLPEDAAVIVADAAAMHWPPAGKKK
ncbi:MAG: alpha/beta hydrolase domain-containing protein, partial [Reyranella sp.]